MSEFLTTEWQKVQIIKSGLDSPFWQLLKEKIQDKLGYEKSKIENLLKEAVLEKDLQLLNSLISRKHVLEELLLLEDELVDDCENSPTQEAEHNTSDQTQER